MTGKPQFNFPAFDSAEQSWRVAGWAVVSPANLTRRFWRNVFNEEFDVNNPDPRIVAGGDIYEEFLRVDIAEIAQCNAIALLPGWENSKGVAKELTVARLLKLEEYDAVTMEPHVELADVFVSTHPHTTLPTDPAARKNLPLMRGLLDYFPAALAEVAHVSKVGNDQHNPGEEMHWARGKSMDHADCAVRHLMERGTLDSDGLRHTAKAAWRMLAELQVELERAGAPLPRGARAADAATNTRRTERHKPLEAK